MTLLNNVQSIPEIENALHAAMQRVTDFSKKIEDKKFFTPLKEKWSMAENLDHLILSNGALMKALTYSKEKLIARFGQPTRVSMSGKELTDKYLNALKSKDAKASPPYIPVDIHLKSKADLLKTWANVEIKIKENLKNWSEKDLDAYQLPHPLVGHITIRELLLFSVFHTQHHLNAMNKGI